MHSCANRCIPLRIKISVKTFLVKNLLILLQHYIVIIIISIAQIS